MISHRDIQLWVRRTKEQYNREHNEEVRQSLFELSIALDAVDEAMNKKALEGFNSDG